MIKDNHYIPIRGLDGESLANTSHEWECGDELFTYVRNSDGYRSDNFVHNPMFLFAGCSETFGESAEYETTWAYKLFNKIKNDQDVYCNIGLPGIDISLVIHHIMMFIEKYGKPKNLFVVFPQFNRILETSEPHTSTVIFTYDPKDNNIVKSDNVEYSDSRIINAVRSVNLLQIKNFERFCEELEINLIWGTWCVESHKKGLQEGIFNHYVNILNHKDVADLALELGYSPLDIKLQRSDGNHHGELFHDYWAKTFADAYNKRKSLTND